MNIIDDVKSIVCNGIEVLFEQKLLEMQIRDAGIRIFAKQELTKAMQILMNRLIKPEYKNNRYYIQTESFVSFITNGKKVSYPLFMASGFYDRKKIIDSNITIVDKGTGVKHLLSHINNIKKLNGKNFRDGVDKNGNPVITSQVSFDCYETALSELEHKLSGTLQNGVNGVSYQYRNNMVDGIKILVPISYNNEELEFTFIIELPRNKFSDITIIKAGYPNKNSISNLKRKNRGVCPPSLHILH